MKRGVASLLLCLALSACSSLGYYAQLLQGQVSLLRAREPIARLVDAPETEPRLRERLRLVQAALGYAQDALLLPSQGSYRQYADLDRPYVMWNVFATPEFSLDAIEWCYPIAGCLAYRGYYDKAGADAEAQRLVAAGRDVHVGGVPAYSTLGWFDDPVLSTMLRWDDRQLVGTLFHELAHQRLFVKGDTEFNESFASFVEEQGLRSWLSARGEDLPDLAAPRQRQDDFVKLVQSAREALRALYAGDEAPEVLRVAKAAVFERLRAQYRQLRDGRWQGYAGYDRWFEQDLNNATLLPVGIYNGRTAAFAALFARCDSDWACFYDEAARIGDAPADRRRAQLDRLQADDAAAG